MDIFVMPIRITRLCAKIARLRLLFLFGGREASRRALDLLGVIPTRRPAFELDANACWAAADVYPDAMLFNSF